ncbi:MAG: hypothetical protein ACHP7E_01430 [Burkholderiales bacterium]
MKSALVIAAAFALCGSAFATTGTHHAQTHNGVMATVKQDAHQIGSSFHHDMHTIARAPKFREQEGMDQHHATQTRAMGAGSADTHVYSSRDERMESAYADWDRSHRR